MGFFDLPEIDPATGRPKGISKEQWNLLHKEDQRRLEAKKAEEQKAKLRAAKAKAEKDARRKIVERNRKPDNTK